MQIKQKWILGFLLLMLLVGVVGYFSLTRLSEAAGPLDSDVPQAIEQMDLAFYLHELSNTTRYYDEVLTQSARNYAFTQDKKWELRYRDIEPKLDNVIKQAIEKGGEESGRFFESVDGANIALVKMEYESIELVSNGQAEKAVEILESSEYWDQKEIYKQGLENYVHERDTERTEALSASIKAAALAAKRTMRFTKIIVRSAVFFIIFVLVSGLILGTLVARIASGPVKKFGNEKIGLLFLKVLVLILFCEFCAMLILQRMSLSGVWMIAMNLVLLGALAAPLLYRYTIRPIYDALEQQKKADKTLEALNSDLSRTAQKLQAANHELKDFVYIASHDLREPLRKISSFGMLLKDSLEGKLESDDQENIDFMIDGASRMNHMIEGLLMYSRLGKNEIPTEQIDLNETIEQLKQLELAEMLEESGGTVEVPQPLPKIQGLPVQIRQLLQNFIANGIKYRAEGIKPRIAVKAQDLGEGQVRIEVQDNGIGIDEKFRDDVFKMFRRLHSRQEYEGTGIGLAICKRIIERHNGRIGVESTPGQGATFWFILSRASETVEVA